MTQQRTSTSAPAGSADWRVLLAAVIMISLWASAFAAIRVGMRSYSPAGVALLRYLAASFVLALYAWITKMPRVEKRDIPGLAFNGVIGIAFYNLALNRGEQEVTAGTASLIVAASPILMALLARFLLGERLKLPGWIGIGISFLGVALISFKPEEGALLSPGAVIVFGAALSGSIYNILQKPFLRRYNPVQCTAVSIWGATLFLLLFAPELIRQLPAATAESTLATVYLGVFPGAIGYVGWALILSRLSAARAGSLLYLIPAVAIGIAWVWLGEIPSLVAVAGGVLVLAGVILVNMRGRG